MITINSSIGPTLYKKWDSLASGPYNSDLILQNEINAVAKNSDLSLI